MVTGKSVQSVSKKKEHTMPNIRISKKLLAAAVKALGLSVPIYTARKLADGRILMTSRLGKHIYEPPKPKRKPKT
jgi:hypothetical protein